MAEMIERYLITLPDGETKKFEQILEQFPAGWEIQEDEKANSNLKALQQVVKAIEQSNKEDDCKADIKAFEDYLVKLHS